MNEIWYNELISFKKAGKDLPHYISEYINVMVGSRGMSYITSEELEKMWEEINK